LHTRPVYLSGVRSSAGRAGKVRIKNFIERGCGVDAAAGVVEAQRVKHGLATVVVSEIKLTVRRRQVANSADTNVPGVNVQTVYNVSNEHHRIVVPLLNAARDVQYEHHIHLLAAICILHHDEDMRLNYLEGTEIRTAIAKYHYKKKKTSPT